ncbi:MAG TPA: FixH family protein [Cellvibrionaceae bacterium]|nr:FixH family protein [Cellvibrionaceae bacterium]HMW72833.1 FixH family protein [Cellvibrionaceae bacterium]HMY38838.1 FixH family protein [Marinagarivorans sp.]HNG59298.1 FixH family protein [Cellvibrionaceae bacterium]
MINPAAVEASVAGKKSSWREPWFWMVLGPLILTILTSLIFVYIAVSGADQRVVDDYYTEGKAINHRFEADKLAAALGVGAQVRVDTVSGEALVELTGLSVFPDQLTLYFSHPVKATDDLTVQLKKINASRYRVDLPKQLAGRWYLQLTPADAAADKKWRLVGELDLNQQQTLTLAPEVQ